MPSGFASTLAFANMAYAGPSSFKKTCRNVGLSVNDSDLTLHAECQKINGSWQRTSINVKSIDNINGVLKNNGKNTRSTYQRSCRNSSVSANRDNVTLSAECKDAQGRWKSTSRISIGDIHNIDGVLRY